MLKLVALVQYFILLIWLYQETTKETLIIIILKLKDLIMVMNLNMILILLYSYIFSAPMIYSGHLQLINNVKNAWNSIKDHNLKFYNINQNFKKTKIHVKLVYNTKISMFFFIL